MKTKLNVFAIPFKRTLSNTKVSLKAFPRSAGSDLFALEKKVIVLHGRKLIKTDLCLKISKGELLEGLVWQILREYMFLMVPSFQNIEGTFILSCLV